MNIILEKFTAKDFHLYYALVSNEEIMRMITGRALDETDAKRKFDKVVQNNLLDESFGNFKIIDADTKTFLGFAKLELKSGNSDEAELGYMLPPEHWGKGIGKKAATLLLESIAPKRLKRVFAIVDPKNIASRKILTNNGFVHVQFKDFDGLPGEVLELRV